MESHELVSLIPRVGRSSRFIQRTRQLLRHESFGPLAKLVAHSQTLLIPDGLEPLQNPPGPQEGRLREPSLQALFRELAAFNTGLCVITTRTPIADIADCEGSSALRHDLEQLSREAGAKLLRALGFRGSGGRIAKCRRGVLRPLSGVNTVGQLSDRCL
jgi:hypothetical protein